MNTTELIKKASSGAITQKEIELVYEALVRHEGDEYELLLVLGRAQARQYRSLVETYLNSPDDPMIASLALQILCQYWGLANEYWNELERFIKVVDWDKEEDVRLMAIGCVAEFFESDTGCPMLLRYVYDIFYDQEEGDITRGAAYETLAIASGLTPSELPQPMHFDLRKDVDPLVMEHAETIIRKLIT